MPAVKKIDEDQPEITLASLARETVRDCDGDVAKAIKRLAGRLRKDAALLESILADIVHDAVMFQVRAAQLANRSQIFAKAGRGDVVALAGGLAASFLDMPLGNGVRLRDAGRDEVVAQADRYDAISSNTGHKARWLRLIAQSIPAGKKVGQVIDDQRAADLWKETADVA